MRLNPMQFGSDEADELDTRPAKKHKAECCHFTGDGREKRPMPDGSTTVFSKPNESWSSRDKQKHFDAQNKDWLSNTWAKGWPSTKNCRNAPFDFPECYED